MLDGRRGAVRQTESKSIEFRELAKYRAANSEEA